MPFSLLKPRTLNRIGDRRIVYLGILSLFVYGGLLFRLLHGNSGIGTAAMVHAVVFGLCVIAAELLLVGLGAGRVANEIGELHRSVAALEAGDFSVRVSGGADSGSEIHQLALAFNSMAERMENWHVTLERQVAERTRELRREKDTAQRYLDVAGVMLVYIDRTGHIGMINKSGATLLGRSEQELIGLDWFEHFIPAEHEEEMRGVFLRLMSQEEGFPEYYENAVVTTSGEKRVLSWHNILLRDDEGVPQGVLASGDDVTGRRRSEMERAEMERQLLHAQKLESLGVLAGGIAHDFNNLLMAIGGNIELAGLRVQDPRARSYIENALAATARATDLTRQMLAYSGKGGYCVKMVSLEQLVAENADLLKATIPKTTTLTTALHPDLPPVEADPGQIQQVIMNLITNAAEAIGEQAGVITIATGLAAFDREALALSRLEEKPAPGDYLFIEVTDNGCGMDEETQRRLFEPFFTTKFTGRGLGLSAVLGIIRSHKGAILISSAPGQGSRIQVLFPAAGPVQSPEAAEPRRTAQACLPEAPATSLANGKKVLIVDDEPGVRMICSEMVEDLGYHSLVASDGKEGVELFRAHAEQISSVIMDLSMPEMDGLQASAMIRKIRPEVAMILSSGYSEEAAGHVASCQGARFIQKPYKLEALREALSSCADRA